MRKLFVTLFLALSVGLAFTAHAAEPFANGKDYFTLKKTIPVRDSSKVEVVELFWYGCPHCYKFDPYVAAWDKKQPEHVDFWHSPAVFSKLWKLHAQAFYTAEALGVGKQMHIPLFNALVRDKRRITTEGALTNLFVENGIEQEKFEKAFNSFSVRSQVEQAAKRTMNYKITGVPAIIVNGKYRVEPGAAGTFPRMLQIVDYLVEKEKAAM